ncbi:Choline kinase alpha [Nymphon striatum]|nr:Choline kinase alpha [Nymphon striatum]
MGIPLEVQFRHLNTFSKQAVNIFGDIESPCLTLFSNLILFVLIERKEKALGLCNAFLGGAWKQISCDEMEFWQLTGGTVNLIYCCGLPSTTVTIGNEPRNILMRLSGKSLSDKEAMEEVVRENVIFVLLSTRNLGPKLHGIFEGGRLEEYIPAPCLKRNQLMDPSISKYVAQRLAQVHAQHIPISKEPSCFLRMMERYNHDINVKILKPAVNEEEFVKFSRLQSYKLDEEWKWLRTIIEQSKSPVVFSHNDLAAGNILYKANANSDSEKVTFIDFEFGSYNYRAFDLANHFSENMFAYDRKDAPYFDYYPESYPTTEERLHFIRTYMNASQQIAAGRTELIFENIASTSIMTEEEENMMFEIDIFVLLSHYLWGTWALLMSYTSGTLFGFWVCGETRLQGYFAHKKKLLSTNAKFMQMVENMKKNQNIDSDDIAKFNEDHMEKAAYSNGLMLSSELNLG